MNKRWTDKYNKNMWNVHVSIEKNNMKLSPLFEGILASILNQLNKY